MKVTITNRGRSPHSVVVNVLDSDIVLSVVGESPVT